MKFVVTVIPSSETMIKLITKMKAFGYKVTLSYADNIDTFDDYISVIKENQDENIIIKSDFKLDKHIEDETTKEENKGIKFVFTMLSEKWTNK